MISQEKDKFICEKLGVCWHEWTGELVDVSRHYAAYEKCSCGLINCKESNPDFTSEAGRVQLLKLMDDNHDWNLRIRGYMPFIIINWIKNDNGEFRDEVFKWFGGEE